ncbi:MAG: hypothetical protein Q8M24_00040 [Pseudolabrys sp.]|nr:hypothetical protein [Pseudolabrys sp.]MDP2293837.1 hypothetical protein [Pseudolabrys sp.]
MAIANLHDARPIDDTIKGYARFASQRVAQGWAPLIVTMMFNRLHGMPEPILPQMFDEASRVYQTFVTRVVRRPLSPRSVDDLPVMIAAPDFSVGKTDKPIARISLNDGLHLHAILRVPPRSRLPIPVDEHFRTHQALYVNDRSKLSTLDVRPINDGIELAAEYVLKSVRRRRFSPDEVLVLPRALAEMRD